MSLEAANSAAHLLCVDVHNLDELIKAVKADETVINANFTNSEIVNKVNDDVKPYLD